MSELNKYEFKIKIPEDRGNFIVKIIIYIFLGIISFITANKISIYFSTFIVLIFFILIYEKLYMFFNVDEILISKETFYIVKNDQIKYEIPIHKLSIKVFINLNNLREISLYELNQNKKLIFFREDEINKKDFDSLILYLNNITKNEDFFLKGTYGEILPLINNLNNERNNESFISEMNYLQKKDFFNSYSWLIIFTVIALVLLTIIYK